MLLLGHKKQPTIIWGSETEAVTRGKVTKESAGASFGVGTSPYLTQKLRSRTCLQLKLFGEQFRHEAESKLLTGSGEE